MKTLLLYKWLGLITLDIVNCQIGDFLIFNDHNVNFLPLAVMEFKVQKAEMNRLNLHCCNFVVLTINIFPVAGAHLIILPITKDTTVIYKLHLHFNQCFDCRQNSLISGAQGRFKFSKIEILLIESIQCLTCNMEPVALKYTGHGRQYFDNWRYIYFNQRK